MTARIIDGKAIAADFRAECKVRVDRLLLEGVRPGLAVVLVGDDPASQVYVRNKARACAEAGMHSEVHRLAGDTTQAALLEFIARLNADAALHGVLVQLPLPRHIDNRTVIEAIDPAKDVDGFHLSSIGRLVVGNALYPPCTPWGAMKLLEHEGIAVEGQDAVVVGRSLIVGKPMAFLLIDAGATVTVCHSKTRDLVAHCRRADILVAAVGRANMIGADWVKPGATVIDVGINRLADGTLAGDVDFAAVRVVAGWITPVPGGVGPMTIAMLLGNTVRAAEIAAGRATSLRETRIA
jgi:methylenetetrahydrofolate dehydrogenase (NADP+)/methenyltetrahydrofolate cyclohydrolase